MPDAERLTDERVREIERIATEMRERGVGVDYYRTATVAALAREVLAARAGDREEREGLRRLLSNRLERIEIDGMVRAGRHLALQQWLSALDILAPEVER